MTNEEYTMTVEEKKIRIFPGPAGSPIVYLPCFMDEGKAVVDLVREMTEEPFTLVSISDLNWDDDLSPWYCAPVFKKADPNGGKADAFLDLLIHKIIPQVESQLETAPSYRAIAGYSLAGLFALYSLYRTDIFSRAASMSGSLWFPDFLEYTRAHEMLRKPDCVYLSLGDRESRTRNQILQTVQERTEALEADLSAAGIPTVFELNPGNHYQDSDRRSARGIVWMLEH